MKDPFAAVLHLRDRAPSGSIQVTHGDYTWAASLEWFSPASPGEIEAMLRQAGTQLPEDYLQLLREVSNGALIYRDEHDQWGYRIYGATELAPKQLSCRDTFGEKWSPNFLAFADLFGDPNVMAFDFHRRSKDGSSFAVIEADPLDPIALWPKVSRSFHEWLDHLVTAQGDKYWEWY